MSRIRKQFMSRRWSKYGLEIHAGVWMSKNEDPFRSTTAHNLVTRYCERHLAEVDSPLSYFSILAKAESLYLGGRKLQEVWQRRLRYF